MSDGPQTPRQGPVRPELPIPSLGAAAPDRAGRKMAPTLFASGDGVWPGILRIMLMAVIFYLPNYAQLPLETGIRGLNPINILVILTLVVMLAMGRKSREPTPLKWPIVLFLLMLCWGFLVAVAGDSSAWVEDLTALKNGIFYVLLYFLFFHAVQDMKLARVLAAVLLFVVFTSAYLGFRQAADYGIGVFNETRRVAAPFGWAMYDANRSAVYFCIFLPLVGSVALFMKSRPWLRLACALLFALGVFVVFHTYSRQSYFILVAVAVLLTLRKSVLVTALVCVALLNYELWVPDSVVERIEMTSVDPVATKRPVPQDYVESLSTDFHKPIYGTVLAPGVAPPSSPGGDAGDESRYDESTESRFILWAGAWELIQENPLGIGLNRFKREIGAHVPTILAGKDAHNFYVLFTTEAGVLAPVSLLILLFGLYRLSRGLLAIQGDEEARVLGMGFAVGLVSVIIGNIYGSRFLDGDVMGNFWIMAALVARVTLLKRQEQAGRGVAAPAPIFGAGVR